MRADSCRTCIAQTLSTAELEALIDAALAELDRRAGDPDLEPEEDRCAALDDAPLPVCSLDCWPGDPCDAEAS